MLHDLISYDEDMRACPFCCALASVQLADVVAYLSDEYLDNKSKDTAEFLSSAIRAYLRSREEDGSNKD